MHFDIKKTELYEYLDLEPLFKLFKIIKIICLTLLIPLIYIFGYNFYNQQATEDIGRTIILAFAIYLISRIALGFFEEIKRNNNQGIKKASNLADFLSFNSLKYIKKAIKQSNGQLSSSLLLYHFLDEKNPKISFIFSRLMIDLKQLKEALRAPNNDYLDLSQVMASAANSTLKRKGEIIKEGDIIAALSEIEPNLEKILTDLELDREDVENINWWLEETNKKLKELKKSFSYNNLIKFGSVGKDWTSGYTITLDKFSIDWTREIATRGYEEIVGHEKEALFLEKTLSRKGNKNALLVGEIGSGRKIIIHSLIRKSIAGLSTPEINNKRFVQLDLVALSSVVDSFEKMEQMINSCLAEAVRAGNVILIINDFHDFLGSKRKAGVTDISSILMPYLNSPRLQLICLTSFESFHKYIEPKEGIVKLFEKIEVPELSKEETMLIIQDKVFALERDYNKFISYEALKEIVNASAKFIPYPFPQKAITLLEDTVIHSDRYSDNILITKDIVDTVLTEKTQIPIGKVKSEEKETLLNLENVLQKRIVGQIEAIKEISSALRRARSGVQSRKGPMGNFLFLGPTGVGKTETAKALAETYFKSEERMIRLDMSDYQRLEDIPRLVGTETNPGILTSKVREDPFSLVLLDEIEKAHPDILNLFLQVLDEGYLNDGLGRKVNFTNTIIIATSNAGYEIILKAIEQGEPMEETRKDLLDFIFEKGMFRPEFINRFDGVIVFKSLSKEDLLGIAKLQLEKIKKTLKEKKIDFIITEELKTRIVELSYNPIFGAREMRRVIQDKIENSIAKSLLSNKILPGTKIEINPKNFEVVIN